VSSAGLIVALDVETLAAAEGLAERLAGVADWLKVGLELFTAVGPAGVRALARRTPIMLDLKLHDIPETVARATARAADLGVGLLTVHTAGGRKMLEAAAKTRGATKLLGVTVLTSMDDHDLAEVGTGPSVAAVVARRAALAVAAGLQGVVSAVTDAAAVRAAAPRELLIVTPGIRPAGGEAKRSPGDDQKRIATPAAARAAGADLIVVGRPIRDAEDPRAAAAAIQSELASA